MNTTEYHQADGTFHCPCGSAIKHVQQHLRSKKHTEWTVANPAGASGMRQQYPNLFPAHLLIADAEREQRLALQRAEQEARELGDRLAMERNVALHNADLKAANTLQQAWLEHHTDPNTPLGMQLLFDVYYGAAAAAPPPPLPPPPPPPPSPAPESECVFDPEACGCEYESESESESDDRDRDDAQ